MRTTISTKLLVLALTFGVGFALFAVIGAFGLQRVKVNGPAYAQIVQGKDLIADVLPPPVYILEAYLVALQTLGERDPAAIALLSERGQQLRKDFEDRLAYWQQNLGAGDIHDRLLAAAAAPARTFFDLRDQRFLPAIAAGQHDEASRLAFAEMKQAYETHRRAIDEIVVLTNDQNANVEARTAHELDVVNWTLWAVGGALFVVMCGALWVVSRSIVTIVTRLVDDLRVTAGRTMRESLRLERSSGAVDQGTSQSAAALEETSASMVQMTSLVRQTSANTVDALALAAAAKAAGDRGIAAVGGLMTAIGSIKDNADKTAHIVKTIDEIAFQTNLLALNASVEAARAGDAGKGFAVVAEEVRSLAGRAAAAARHTSDLIETSVASSDAGVRNARDVMTVVTDMTKASIAVEALVTGIAASSQEIATGIAQVSKAIHQVDAVTQANAAAASETSAIGQELRRHAGSLDGMLSVMATLVAPRKARTRQANAAAAALDSPATTTGRAHRGGGVDKKEPLATGQGSSR